MDEEYTRVVEFDGLTVKCDYLRPRLRTTGDLPSVKGIVQNTSGEVYTSVSLRFHLYDGENVRFEDLTVRMDEVEPGEVVHFEKKYPWEWEDKRRWIRFKSAEVFTAKEVITLRVRDLGEGAVNIGEE